MSKPFVLIALIRTLPGKGAEQVAAFAKLAPLVRAEEGCEMYELHPVQDDPDQFVMMERWASDAALAAHFQAPHMIAAKQTNAAFRDGPAKLLKLGDAL